MAATLALVFRSRLRLLPLALALAAAAITFGALSLLGGSLTMASIAVLPVLIGLAVDYAIQFQARYDEAARRAATPIRPRPQRRPAVRPSSPRGWPPRSASSCSCSRPCPWCAASAPCSCSASGSRCCAPSAPASPRWFASAARPTRPARPADARGAGRAGAPPARGARARVAGRPLLARAGPGDLAAAPGAGRGPGGGRGGAGARHPERGGVRRPRARAPGPAGAQGRGRAPGGDRRVGRDRRDGPAPTTSPSRPW